MQHTLDAARRKLSNTKGSWWSVVTDPTTALFATLHRIGWKCHNAATLITDEGRSIDIELDLPVAVASAASQIHGHIMSDH